VNWNLLGLMQQIGSSAPRLAMPARRK